MRQELDRRLAALAGVQRGLVTHAQLVEHGLDDSAIRRRVLAGRLHRVHRGVYAVGHRHLDVRAVRLAAVLACGPGAVGSHHTAAVEWRLVDADPVRVHVSVPSYAGRERLPGVRLHRTATLTRADVTARDGLPVTTPARTIEDLAGRLRPWEVVEAVARARARGLLDRPLRQTRLPGARVLRAAIAADAADGSVLEEHFAALVRRSGLPRPRRQIVLGAYTVDFLWPEARLVAETDGFRDHGRRRRFDTDRRRDAELAVLGFQVVRFTWWQVLEEPDHVVGTLRRLLARRSVAGLSAGDSPATGDAGGRAA